MTNETDISATNPDAGASTLEWTYAAAPERHPVAIADRYGLFIGGAFRAPKSRRHMPTVNPANEDPISEIAVAGAADVDAAVAAARAAFTPWSRLAPTERAKYLFRIARRIQERARELAVLESMDGGKPIRESRDTDVPLVAHHFFHHAGWCDKLAYAFPGRTPQPVGVCGQIIPWNFPLLMMAWKLAPALACGNTVVIKPAETTSLTALRLAEIIQECELPDGVVNVVTGGPETGAAIVGHPDIDKIAFTGSTEVGKRIARTAAERGIPVTLELGGKSPAIVAADADVEVTARRIAWGKFVNSGQTCIAPDYVLVAEPLRDRLVAAIEQSVTDFYGADP
ncbi:MAG: aldehyde dehydrogenase family protein, partial [Phycisphaerales bacterium]